ncbi:NUDIX hydrolase [Streptomyces sp. 5-10]|uniref:NUDIX hydrolase n=1 Tax=Streptomyces sp. 5-10 TaxID=878925 RepID=UPI00168AB883|nr:NUDIX hydrolase [Streptomyces sp. 5-10]MBD3004835.1 NUDIX hydrolase [Streptomyces sp. 5-10]
MTPGEIDGMAEPCSKTSVGVLIPHPEHPDQFLMFDRNTPPVGTAPPCGHGDGDDPVYAACKESREETGLIVTEVTEILSLWLPNRCRREPGSRPHGHHWTVVMASGFTGEIKPSVRETRNMRWMALDDIRKGVDRTIDRAQGRITEAELFYLPGIEPVWCHLLHEAGIIQSGTSRLDAFRWLYTQDPRS